MENKIVIKEVGTVANPQRFANRIEPVNDKEINQALFSLYDSLIEPVKDIEADVNKIKENQREISYINGRSHHAIIKFIIIYILAFALLINYGRALEIKYEKEYNASQKLQEEYRDPIDYTEFKSPFYNHLNGDGWTDMFIYPAYASIFTVIVLYILERMYDKQRIKNIEKTNKDIEVVIADKVQVIKNEISFVPPKYRHSHALQYFVESYENSRINNLLEAVNLYDTFEHRQNVEGALLVACNLLQQIAYNQVVEIEQIKGLRRDIWASEAIF